jgi:hypothetical protein
VIGGLDRQRHEKPGDQSMQNLLKAWDVSGNGKRKIALPKIQEEVNTPK